MSSCRVWLAAVVLVLASCDGGGPVLRVHRVQSDETLGHLAAQTGVSVAKLRELNHLASDTINFRTGVLVPDTEKTRALPKWRPPRPALDWKRCEAVEWLPAVELEPDEQCFKKVCAGDACLCVTMHDTDVEVEATFAGQKLVVVDSVPRELRGFRHARVDLDGDGRPESVISVLGAVGNGLGIEWWHHTVFHEGQAVASFITNDFGASFVAMEKGCALLATSETWRDDQLRGEGSYWVGQLHVLNAGAMRAVGPEVVRRYTRRFATQRWASFETELVDPVPWFTDVGAFIWPERTLVTTSCHEGRVVLQDDLQRFDLGPDGLFQRRITDDDGDLAPGAVAFDLLVDRVTHAALLEEYLPAGVTSWANRPVEICRSVTDEGVPYVTLGL